MRSLIIVFALITLVAIAIGCAYFEDSLILPTTSTTSTTLGSSTTTSSSTTTTQALISGPDRGVGVNNGDSIFRSLAVSTSNANLVYLGSEGNGIFKSTDGGSNWSWLRNGLLDNGTAYPEIYDMVIDPSDNSKVFAATVDSHGPITGNYPSAYAGPYKSTDSGGDWLRKTSGFNNSYTSAIAIDPNDQTILYVALSGGYPSFTGTDVDGVYFDGGVFKSTDSGGNWTDLNVQSPTNTSRIVKLVAWDSNNLYFIGTNHSDTSEAIGLMKTTDAGSNWTSINTPNYHFAEFGIAPLNKNIIIISQRDSSQTYITTNEGASWSLISFYSADVIEISPHDSDIVLFSHTNALYKSSNAMQSWTQVLTAEANVQDIVFSQSNSNIIYAAGANYKLYKSTDGGDSFVEIADIRNFIDTH